MRLECVVKSLQQHPARRGLEVAQQTPAANDEIEVREREMREHVMTGEYHRVAQVRLHSIAACVGREESSQARLRYGFLDGGRIKPDSRTVEQCFVTIAREHLNQRRRAAPPRFLEQLDRKGVRLLARGAIDGPNAQPSLSDRFQVEQPRQDLVLEPPTRLGPPEELRHVEQQILGERRRFRRVGREHVQVIVQAGDSEQTHALVDARGQERRSIHAEVAPRAALEQRTKLAERAVGGTRVERFRQRAAIADDGTRDLPQRQHEIDDARVEGAARHAVVLGFRRILDDDETAAILDPAQPLRSIAAGAREHDADAALAMSVGKRTQHVVDRPADGPAGIGGCGDAQVRIDGADMHTWRNHEHAARLQRRRARYLSHGQLGVRL